MSYKRVELHEGAQVQFVGIYATRWPYESGVEPTVGFIEIDDDEAEATAAELRAQLATVTAQRDAARALLAEVLPEIKEEIGAIGDDHTVGICCCDLIRLADRISEALP